jgi:glycosyltransferase involved in cell wall biosynthesis
LWVFVRKIACPWRVEEADDVKNSNEDKKGVYIVVPAYNEAPRIGKVLRELQTTGYKVVAVDDGSFDGSWESMKQSGLTRLRHPVNCGQGAALQTGITYALLSGAEYVVTFDADGQHCVEDIDLILQPLREGECDVTLGSRFLGQAPNMPWMRRMILKGGILFTRIVSGISLTDTHNGLRGFTRNAAEQLDITLSRMAHASQILHQIHHLGLRHREVPVRIEYSEEVMAKGQESSNAFRVAFRFLASLVTK